MQIHSIGPSDFVECWTLTAGQLWGVSNELDRSRYLWAVIWFEDQHFNGDGEMVALGHDGMLHRWDLCHTDGYSPVSNWDEEDVSVSVDDYVTSPSSCVAHGHAGVRQLQERVLALLQHQA